MVVLASAGLIRLRLQDRLSQRLPSYHAVGEGFLGVEIRQDDDMLKSFLKSFDDVESTVCCLTESSLFCTMEGVCSMPLGLTSFYNINKKGLTLNCIVIDCESIKFVEDLMTVAVHDIYYDSIKCSKNLPTKIVDNGAR